jgi:hypothetical protein
MATKPQRKPLYPDTPGSAVDPKALACHERYKNAEDPPRRQVWAVGRFLRDFKVWALSGGGK